MSDKAIICRCEDVTLSDVQHTLSLGYKSIEEVKRYTGLGTGPCEGKECMVHCARLVAQVHGGDESVVLPFTSRPPVQPVPLAIFAHSDDDGEQA